MDTTSLSSVTVPTGPSAAMLAEYSARVLRKALDSQTDQGAQLAQMVAQGAGVGQNLDVKA